MAIQISGCTVIDNSRNITNANNMCVGVVTMTGSTGNIETPGTITAGGLDVPPRVISFRPADGATNVAISTNIVIAFDQLVGIATIGIGATANITLRNSSGIGTVIQTIGIAATNITISESVVTINPPSDLPFITNVFVVIDAGAFTSLGGDSQLINTYDFTTTPLNLGDSYEGGFLICKASPVRWVVSPYSTEVNRTWYQINHATTMAQAVTGCTGWFVPGAPVLQNPGYCCRSFWGPSPCFNVGSYWSTSYVDGRYNSGCLVSFSYGNSHNSSKSSPCSVRAFRCVTY